MGTARPIAATIAALAAALAATSAAAERLDLERGGQHLVDHVNRAVNRQFEPLAAFDDPNGDGVWDCENYAAEKRARLIQAGVPASDLQLWRVLTSRGVSHAVLVIAAERRGRPVDLVLDNLSEWATPRTALPYTGWAPLFVDARAAVTPTAETRAARRP